MAVRYRAKATKKRTKAGRTKKAKPEMVVGAVTKAGKVQMSKAKLAKFLKRVLTKYPNAKVQFVARNAPFMRRPPMPPA